MNNPQVDGDQNQFVNSSSNPQSLSDEKAFPNSSSNSSSNLQSLSDQTLYQLCRTYGARALEWRRKFTGLLPEVFRRKLYEKKGFDSIFVFAKKLAGLSEEQVRLVLNLEKRFENVPALRALLVNGEVSVNKLARVVAIANPENQKFLAEQVRILSKGAVETLVRDEKWACADGVGGELGKNQDGLFEPKTDYKSLPGQTLEITIEVHQKLFELQQKGLDLNQLLLEFLKKREEEIAERKERITEEVLRKEEKKALIEEEVLQSSPQKARKKSRPYIIKAVRQILHDEHGTKCSIKNCQKLAETIHHTQRFALSGSHDPHYLAPLCKEHHEIAHACDVKCQEVKKRWVGA